jgi:hypothetical protein
MAAESIWPGMFQAEAGSGNTARVKRMRDRISDTAVSYAKGRELKNRMILTAHK